MDNHKIKSFVRKQKNKGYGLFMYKKYLIKKNTLKIISLANYKNL